MCNKAQFPECTSYDHYGKDKLNPETTSESIAKLLETIARFSEKILNNLLNL